MSTLSIKNTHNQRLLLTTQSRIRYLIYGTLLSALIAFFAASMIPMIYVYLLNTYLLSPIAVGGLTFVALLLSFRGVLGIHARTSNSYSNEPFVQVKGGNSLECYYLYLDQS